MTTDGKLRVVKVFVRSKRVAVSSIVVHTPARSIIAHATLPERTVLYEDQLEENQKLMVRYATELATQTGLSIKIVDLSKLGVFQRMLNSVLKKFPGSPAIFVPDSLFTQIMKDSPMFDSIKSMNDGLNTSSLLTKIN